MKELSWEEIYSNLKKKIFHPVYILMGEEPFYIDVISDQIEELVLTETERDFNQTVFYGKDTDAATVMTTAKRYPMMASHQVIILKEAQTMKDFEKLEEYFIKPQPSTVLVVCYKYKTVDRRKAFFKKATSGVVMNSKKIYDNKMPEWIAGYVKKSGYKIGSKATQMLADHLGNDLGKVVNEIKKVYISLPRGEEITPLIIEKNIGISKDYNVFELQDALGSKNSFKAFQIARYFGENTKSSPMVLIMGSLHSFFSKLLIYHSLKDKSQANVAAETKTHPFLVSNITKAANNYPPAKLLHVYSCLREYDLRSKGVDNQSASWGELYKELFFKIMN